MKKTDTARTPVIGVIGGAGPDATIDFQVELSQQMKLQCQAINDQTHFRVIVDNYTTMPDRIQALHGKGPSPLPYMQTVARNLEQLGATLIVYPCNTAHAYIADIQAAVSTPILDIISLTTAAVINHSAAPQHIGILSTDMTRKLQLHQIPNRTLIYPDAQYQAQMMQAIFAAKAGYTKHAITDHMVQQQVEQYLQSVGISPNALDFSQSATTIIEQSISHLIQRGAEAIVLGCTEIPLCVEAPTLERFFGIPIINPTAELAKATVALARAQRATDSAVLS
jgi:aspartate racemase